MRPSFRYLSPKGWEAHAGLGLFYTENTSFFDVLEVRPWQGFWVKWPQLGKIAFSHYFRFEQRLLFDTDTWTLDSELRLRYKLGTKIPVTPLTTDGRLFLPLSIELFSQPEVVIEQVSNRLRIDAGLGYVFGELWVGEFHLIIQRSRSGLADKFRTADLIFRFELKRLVATRDYAEPD